jgi:queuine tRNA-ribosyltransferase catalytic subunit
MRLMKGIRTSIKEDRFPQFVREFLAKLFPKGDYPKWVCEALDAVNIKVKV